MPLPHRSLTHTISAEHPLMNIRLQLEQELSCIILVLPSKTEIEELPFLYRRLIVVVPRQLVRVTLSNRYCHDLLLFGLDLLVELWLVALKADHFVAGCWDGSGVVLEIAKGAFLIICD